MNTYGAAFAALADPTRRSILELLRDGPMTVAELAGKVPVSRPAVSQHLAVLREAHLVTHERSGTRHLYSADPQGLQALRDYLTGVWGQMLGEFAQAAGREAARSMKSEQTMKSKEGRQHGRGRTKT